VWVTAFYQIGGKLVRLGTHRTYRCGAAHLIHQAFDPKAQETLIG
jgi:glycerol dehydrogenase-like iron-containing ADH family enzyme